MGFLWAGGVTFFLLVAFFEFGFESLILLRQRELDKFFLGLFDREIFAQNKIGDFSVAKLAGVVGYAARLVTFEKVASVFWKDLPAIRFAEGAFRFRLSKRTATQKCHETRKGQTGKRALIKLKRDFHFCSLSLFCISA